MSSKTQFKEALIQKNQALNQTKKIMQVLAGNLELEKKKVKHLEEALANNRKLVDEKLELIKQLTQPKKWWEFWR
jgi:hypothetical protein